MENQKKDKRIKRHRRVRAKIFGTAKLPRLCAFRSNKHIYAQLIDDENSKTILSANDIELKNKAKEKMSVLASKVGELIAEKAEKEKIKKVLFDRGGYKYHGTIKALAEGARKKGLEF